MRAFTSIIFSIALGCAMNFAKGRLDSTISTDEIDEEIHKKIAEVINIKLADQEKTNSKQGLLGLSFSDLVQLLKPVVNPLLAIIFKIIPYSFDTFGGGLNGLGKGGLPGLLSGVSNSITTAFQDFSGQIAESLYKVSDPAQNEIIRKNIQDALTLGKAKRDALCAEHSDCNTNLNYVIDSVLTFVYSISHSLLTILGSAIHRLVKELFGGIERKGLIGGMVDGLEGLLGGLAIGATKGSGDVVSNLLSL